MNPIPLEIAVEDELSESVARRLVQDRGDKFYVSYVYRRGGYGYLRNTIRGWNRASQSRPMLVITDLDDQVCPASLRESWLGTDPLEPNLLFRVAVREVEAWLLADWESLLRFLHVPKRAARNLPPPDSTESVPNPKAELVRLATFSSRREIRQQIVPGPNSTARQGPEYNSKLNSFVSLDWDLSRASKRSSSLRRTIERLTSFSPWGT
jgi:hypothetical protein